MNKRDILQAEFNRLREKYKGRLTPEIIVREARAARSPLHDRFSWNDKQAAHRHRLDVARELMATYVTIRVISRTKTIRAPMMIRDPDAPPNVQGMIMTAESMERGKAERVIEGELTRIEAMVSRARDVASALDLNNPGIIRHFETMLTTVVSARALLDKAA